MTKLLSRSLLVALALGFASVAAAQTMPAPTAVAVAATVNAGCKLQNTPLATVTLATNWDPVNGTNPPAAVTNAFILRCTKGTALNVTVTGGNNPGADPLAARAMSNGAGAFLPYTVALGATADLAATATAVAGVAPGKGTDWPMNFVFDIPAAADPAPGAYTDSVSVTFTVQ